MKLKSYSQRSNERLLREFVGPQGQIDPMGMTPQPAMPMQPPMTQPMQQQPQMGGQMQQNPMGMAPGMGAMNPQMQQQPQMGNPQMGSVVGGQNPAPGQDDTMGQMGSVVGGQNPAPGQDETGMGNPQQDENPGEDLPQQVQSFVKKLSTKSVQQIIQAQQSFNNAVQQMLTQKNQHAGKKGLWAQFNAAKTAKQNYGQDSSAP